MILLVNSRGRQNMKLGEIRGMEASTSNQERESQEDRLEEMNKLIKNLSNKLVKIELEAKKFPPCPN